LLLHFWTPQELGDDARAAMAEDWVTDLAAFNPEIVSKACGEWRKAQTRRPTIADIRKLCIEEQASQRAHYAVVDARADPLAAEEAYARSVGFPSALARRDAIAQREEAYRKAEIWRNSPEAQHDPAIARRQEPTSGNWKPAFSPERMAEEMKAARKALGMEE
jgi:hypothetical protein